jgi:taurine dioxygenase
MTTATAIRVERRSPACGAVITGARLAGGVDDDVLRIVQDAFLAHHMVVIPGQQDMTPDDQLAFAARWGEISVHPYVPSIEGHPGVMKVYDPTPLTQRWHADTTHAEFPPALSMLLARTIPEVGGDTMWSNAHAAYEDLSAGLRATLEGLRAVHQGTALASEAGLEKAAVTRTHPVVRTHPVTGRKALFVNGDYTTHIDGWTAEESAPLLEYLYAQVARAEYVYRHKWTVGDLVIWDNRSTQHAVVGDVGGAERVLHRVTIKGDRPV